jgi:hypothetical protein
MKITDFEVCKNELNLLKKLNSEFLIKYFDDFQPGLHYHGINHGN